MDILRAPSTLDTSTACTCLNQYDHCPWCTATEATARAKPKRPARPKPVASPESPVLLTAAEVARLCSVGTRTIWRLVEQGRFPQVELENLVFTVAGVRYRIVRDSPRKTKPPRKPAPPPKLTEPNS